MRDINRIDSFCNELSEQWKRCPDWRFGQLISNLFGEIQTKHGDIWFIEEPKMMEYIKEAMDSMLV